MGFEKAFYLVVLNLVMDFFHYNIIMIKMIIHFLNFMKELMKKEKYLMNLMIP